MTFLRWLWRTVRIFHLDPYEERLVFRSMVWGLNPPQPDPYPKDWDYDPDDITYFSSDHLAWKMGWLSDEQYDKLVKEKHGTSDL